MTYKDKYHPQVKKDLKKIAPNVREIIKTQYIPKLLLNPKQDEYLSGDLEGIYSYHVKIAKTDYRIAYIVEENESAKTVFVLMIAKRGEFYNLLKQRVKK
ncbi:MAG: type II toxin-antitoxin system mRNA interferase toxin, RelE/StbE family [Pseudomonadota bacterium]|nr:type II toxin-antitoxin system mRNA interferase toxin, RelE/StbE family [Pseudomonadota bacterium]